MNVFIISSKPYDEDYVYKCLKKFDIKSTSLPSKADFVLAIGGDAAVLQSVKFNDMDILPTNTGTVGFLSNDQSLYELIDSYTKKRHYYDRRNLNTVTIEGNELNFLNEVSLLSQRPGSLVDLTLCINEEEVTTYKGDGLIISTASGSTAWNLSCGGSIIDPGVECLMITPNNPFSMNHKPLVVGITDIITIKGKMNVIVDGTPKGLTDLIQVSYKYRTISLVRPTGGPSFYKRIEEKLGWGNTIKQ